MSAIQQTCLTAINQINALYEDKEEMKREINKLGFTAEMKEKLLNYLHQEIDQSKLKIQKLQKQVASNE